MFISANVPLGTEWACPQVLCPIPGAPVHSPEECFRRAGPEFPNSLGAGRVPPWGSRHLAA
eukprot:9484188-Pyramimonas_sp.AAC.1